MAPDVLVCGAGRPPLMDRARVVDENYFWQHGDGLGHAGSLGREYGLSGNQVTAHATTGSKHVPDQSSVLSSADELGGGLDE